MDIKNSVITAKMVIHSLLALLENENVDISSVKFKVGSDGNGYESPEFELEKLVSLAIDGLVEIEDAGAVTEGFVSVEASELESLKSDNEHFTKSCIDWTERAYKQRAKVDQIKNEVERFKQSGTSLDLGRFLDNLIEFSTFKHDAEFDGFVLVPVKEIKTWYLDDSENIYREDPEWLCDIPVGEVVEVEHRVSYELDQDPVFATIQWDEKNNDVGYYETFKSKTEAEKVAAHCKAMVEAQEQSHD